ncbi:MAG TPA: WD40 repeat domain-containing protein, partial [Gemmata sp.]|nr:WD40 repeat domain-containing protein [Gemmata sp.]
SGTATVTLSFAAWKEGQVAATTHSVQVLPAKPGPKAEPVAENLIGTLVHPDRTSTVDTLKFSADGKQLFTTGYPSGIVQVWDVTQRQELRRLDTATRGSPYEQLLTRDWKTLYVPVGAVKTRTIEKEGKSAVRIEYSGSIRVWDMTSGEEKASLQTADGHAPLASALSPDGAYLVCSELSSYDAGDSQLKGVTNVWNLKTGGKHKVSDGYVHPCFGPDGKVFALRALVLTAAVNTSAIQMFDTATGKVLARLDCPEKERYFSVPEFSPDGSVLAFGLGGKKGGPREVWFRDAKTLEDRGQFLADGSADGIGFGGADFTPDGKYYVILGVKDKIVLWEVSRQKVAREFAIDANVWRFAVSRDCHTLAVPWVPRAKLDGEAVSSPDPRDYPQPRITLFDLAGKAPPRSLIAPHGFVGAVAFSPDGKTLAFGTSGGVRLFDLTK